MTKTIAPISHFSRITMRRLAERLQVFLELVKSCWR